MPRPTLLLPAFVMAAIAADPASASLNISGTITADNHYALFARVNGQITLVGGNETGVFGSVGAYNWSVGETWNITNATDLYIAAWSDKLFAQGLLASFMINNIPLLSGDARWRVIATGQSLTDGSPYPIASEIAAYVADANANDKWMIPYVGGKNGVGPWNTVAGIDLDARWMWAPSTKSRHDTINGGGDFDEYLIFHMSTGQVIPAAPTALVAAAGFVALSRRRR